MTTAEGTAMGQHPLVPTGNDWRRSFGRAGSSGRFQFGPYTVSWTRTQFGSSESEARSTFVVASDGVDCSCWIAAAQPYSSHLRRGIPGGLDGKEFVTVRNGPRPLRRLRRVHVRGPVTDWIIGGSWVGAPIRDEGRRVLWTSSRGGRVRRGLACEDAALVVALVATEIPSTTSLLNVLRGL